MLEKIKLSFSQIVIQELHSIAGAIYLLNIYDANQTKANQSSHLPQSAYTQTL